MRYLVMRKDSIRHNRHSHTLQSTCFPIEVEVSKEEIREFDRGRSDDEGFWDYIVVKACNMIHEGYEGNMDVTYIVVPLTDALEVSHKPVKHYRVNVRNYINN